MRNRIGAVGTGPRRWLPSTGLLRSYRIVDCFNVSVRLLLGRETSGTGRRVAHYADGATAHALLTVEIRFRRTLDIQHLESAISRIKSRIMEQEPTMKRIQR